MSHCFNMHLQWALINVFLQQMLISPFNAEIPDSGKLENNFVTAIAGQSVEPEDKENFTIVTIVENLAGDISHTFNSDGSQFIAKKKEKIMKKKRNSKFFQRFKLNVEHYDIRPGISVMDIVNLFCQTNITKKIEAIIIIDNMPNEQHSFAISYVMYLASVFGIPVLTSKSEGYGLSQKALKYTIQVSPKQSFRSSILFSILQRYSWNRFSIVTTKRLGNYEFIQAVRIEMIKMQSQFKMTLATIIQIDCEDYREINAVKLSNLHETNCGIILYYCTDEEAKYILGLAKELGLSNKWYMWVGDVFTHANDMESFPFVHISSLAVSAQYIDDFYDVVDAALELLIDGISSSLVDTSLNNSISMSSLVEWQSDGIDRQFQQIIIRSWDSLRFTPGESFNILGLKHGLIWDKLGSWTPDDLQMNDIIWPEHSISPPTGLTKKLHLKVIFKEEPPFIFMGTLNPISGICDNRGVICKVKPESIDPNIVLSQSFNKSEIPYENQCCAGLSIELLKEFAKDMDFDYDLTQVNDGIWGSQVNGHWNGLVGALMNKEADIALTSFTFNSMRESVIDFSHPFLETRIAILVSINSGANSAVAFLDPFDVVSWIMILIVCIHAAAFSIFLLEWLSPTGYNMTKKFKDNIPSMLRCYWLVWANLFGAAVNVKTPNSTSARFMTGIWALFALVFLGMYTANLTFFMTAPKQYLKLSGITDDKLKHPKADNTPLRYGTVAFGHTDMVLQKYLPNIYQYMKEFNKSNAEEGLRAVEKGELDAFIYDAAVLKYLVGQGERCLKLKVEGGNVMTGYGIGFRKHSDFLEDFNTHLVMYKDNGYLDRLQQEWFSESCHPDKLGRVPSAPLSVNQCMSVFILLALGTIAAIILFLIEHLYVQYRKNGLNRINAVVGSQKTSTFIGKIQPDQNSLDAWNKPYNPFNKIIKRRARTVNFQSNNIQHVWHSEDQSYRISTRKSSVDT